MIFVLALLLWGSLPICNALFADQAGLNDWTKQFIGEVLSTAVSNEKIFVSTKQGAIAALSRNQGEIEWRRVLPKNEIANLGLIVQNHILVSCGPQNIRAWKEDGQMLWDFEVKETRDFGVFDEHVILLSSDKLL